MNDKFSDQKKGLYLGERGENFKTMIENVLKMSKIKREYREILLSEKSIIEYMSAFTSEFVDPHNNYQMYEQLGDVSANRFLVYYFYNRFPQLKCSEGVKIVARLRINYGSKQCFSEIAKSLDFEKYISASEDAKYRNMTSLLEDVFEAFIGVTETIMNENVKIGIGNAVVNKILEKIFDKMNISIKYEDLYDAKTRLKELFDMYYEKIGYIIYEENRNDAGIVKSVIYRCSDQKGRNRLEIIGEGEHEIKMNAQQIASNNALILLRDRGYVKFAPSLYLKFNGEIENKKTDKRNVLKIIGDEKNINELFPTRGKSKYSVSYNSSALGHYCRERDIDGINICLNLRGNPNVLDSEGNSCIDLLLIGRKDDIVMEIMKIIKKKYENIVISDNVRNVYLSQYE